MAQYNKIKDYEYFMISYNPDTIWYSLMLNVCQKNLFEKKLKSIILIKIKP